MIINQNQWKNNDQISCPASTGKEKWMKLTGSVTFTQIFFSLGFDSLLNTKKEFITWSGVRSKVVSDHVFALEYFSYINKYSKTEILAICHEHN